ncbi:MAG: hypothetical protein MZV64_03925 [Ignavibacteriales bacterium]|nr:hypothetical protein [Ignavibacteriales bacterium]
MMSPPVESVNNYEKSFTTLATAYEKGADEERDFEYQFREVAARNIEAKILGKAGLEAFGDRIVGFVAVKKNIWKIQINCMPLKYIHTYPS